MAAARRRLAIYREVTLPMLKAFDEKNRLKIVSTATARVDWILTSIVYRTYAKGASPSSTYIGWIAEMLNIRS